MTFRQTGLCRLIILMLTLCMLTGAVSAALGESEMTEVDVQDWIDHDESIQPKAESCDFC